MEKIIDFALMVILIIAGVYILSNVLNVASGIRLYTCSGIDDEFFVALNYLQIRLSHQSNSYYVITGQDSNPGSNHELILVGEKVVYDSHGNLAEPVIFLKPLIAQHTKPYEGIMLESLPGFGSPYGSHTCIFDAVNGRYACDGQTVVYRVFNISRVYNANAIVNTLYIVSKDVMFDFPYTILFEYNYTPYVVWHNGAYTELQLLQSGLAGITPSKSEVWASENQIVGMILLRPEAVYIPGSGFVIYDATPINVVMIPRDIEPLDEKPGKVFNIDTGS